METKIIEKNEKMTVKAVYFSGKFLYTVIYLKGEDGFVEKIIRVYADCTLEIQQIQQDGKIIE